MPRWSLPVLWQGVLAAMAVVLTWCGLDALGFTYRGPCFRAAAQRLYPKPIALLWGDAQSIRDLWPRDPNRFAKQGPVLVLVKSGSALALLPMLKSATKTMVRN